MESWGRVIKNKTLQKLANRLESELLDNIVVFWLENGLDKDNGGLFAGLDRRGKQIETDKSIWFQGRSAWLFSKLFEKYGNSEYLRAAESIIGFLRDYGFDTDGRMFFRVDQNGRPLIKRRYLFSETFAVIALAAFGKATDQNKYISEAEDLLDKIIYWSETPGFLEPKWNPASRNQIGLAFPMIMIATIQELRLASPEKTDKWNELIEGYIKNIQSDFMNDEVKGVLEISSPRGALLDHFEGRVLNPGHSLEASWFILREGLYRKKEEYIEAAITIFDWMWEWGWDKEYGGMYYFRDALNHPSSEYWHDMKFWWPQCEAVISSLLIWKTSSDDTYLEKFHMALDWAESKLKDPDYPEWFGYLHRDGSLSSSVKGNIFKGPFHIPRMLLYVIMILRDEVLDPQPT